MLRVKSKYEPQLAGVTLIIIAREHHILAGHLQVARLQPLQRPHPASIGFHVPAFSLWKFNVRHRQILRQEYFFETGAVPKTDERASFLYSRAWRVGTKAIRHSFRVSRPH